MSNRLADKPVKATMENSDFLSGFDSGKNLKGFSLPSLKTYLASPITAVNVATYTALATDKKLHVTYTITGACTITIPSALILDNTFELLIKDAGLLSGTNNITIITEGAETIDGDANWLINGNGDWIKLYSDGTNLFIIS